MLGTQGATTGAARTVFAWFEVSELVLSVCVCVFGFLLVSDGPMAWDLRKISYKGVGAPQVF